MEKGDGGGGGIIEQALLYTEKYGTIRVTDKERVHDAIEQERDGHHANATMVWRDCQRGVVI